MAKEKTHWLQSPNKNYLGHWDLPNGDDLVLTIESAGWEKVKNPITNKTEAKRVIRFKEEFKPMICNQTNAQSIIKSTSVKFMEDSKGARVQLYVGIHKDRISKEDVDCIRVRRAPVKSLAETLAKLKLLFKQKEGVLVPKEIEQINRVIDGEETLSYDKVIKFLNTK